MSGSNLEKYIKRDKKSALSLNNYAISKDNIELIKALLASGASAVNILLYGKAGTGKTEFARSISASTGKDIYFLQYGEEKNNNNSRGSNNDTDKRLLALNVAINSVSSKKGILIVDEADFLLNTKSMFFSVSNTTEKGWLNNLLENSDAKIIWISNEVGLMEESTLRRFSYSLYFKEFTNNER